MSKVIKNVKVDWSWIGDSYSLVGFNVSVTPSAGRPDTNAVAYTTIRGGSKTCTFNNVVLDDAVTYTAWVQALYNGKDGSWVNTSNFSVSDDGTATVETRTSNVANQWRHATDPNKIDGGDIYANSISATSINLYDGKFIIYNSNQGNTPSFSVNSSGEVALSGNLKSFNYSDKNNTGWSITQDGNAILNQATVRGSIYLPNAGLTDQNSYRMWAGSANPYTSWTTTTSANSNVGDKTLTLTSITNIVSGVNQLIKIGNEQKMIINLNTTSKVATLDSALVSSYASGTTVTLTLLAPFTVAQDGSIYANKGNFNGSFTGKLDVGNIHITDTDPNPTNTTTGASLLINTDNDARTVIKLQELGAFIDTKFSFGNDLDQYFMVDNANALIDINNNKLVISQFTKNLLSNSGWINNTTSWSAGGVGGASWSRDTSTLFNGYPTYKISRTGLASNSNAYIIQTLSGTAGTTYVASVYIKTDDYTKIDDSGVWIEMVFYNSGGTQLTDQYITFKPTDNNWNRYTFSYTAPANTATLKFDFGIYRNGNVWVACPQVEVGTIPSAYGVTALEQKDLTFPNRPDGHYIEFDGNNFNFDIKSDNTFYFQSNSTSSVDFKFAKENSNQSNQVSVLIDGDLTINDSIKMGKLTILKKTDSGNQGIDFIFS